ncbi:hypothetical protein HGA04_19755 [Gordonia rubripertincta]|uniref:hypothetical protein n=1 Tax=Gordonia rubripertincta TaxID=36822 RepID=UPI001443B5A4|nr:hypothetical protein [Gordonia rubripertincta]NKY64873.1 hypothetical protein [Gordonia rubripertincta]
MDDLLHDIQDRGAITPKLTAVRLGDKALTYGELAHRIDEYDHVCSAHGMSQAAAFYAALMNCLPLGDVQPLEARMQAIGEVEAWLGRGRGTVAPTRSHLRAVS